MNDHLCSKADHSVYRACLSSSFVMCLCVLCSFFILGPDAVFDCGNS